MRINYVAVLIAAVVQFVLGLFWYKVVFRKSWKALTGYVETSKTSEMFFSWTVFFLANFILSFVMLYIDNWAGVKVADAGAKLGVVCWLGFMAPPLFAQHVFEHRRANLFAINAAYWLLAMAIGSGLVAALGYH
jgi:hypothetical protein